MLGALQVSQSGDIANWNIPKKMMKGIGGAMDLVAGVDNIIVCTTHVNRDGKPKLLKECTLPLTGKRVIKKIITDMAVFEVKSDGSGLILTEIEKGVSLDDIKKSTEAEYIISPNLKEMPHAPYNKTYTNHLVPGAATIAAKVDTVLRDPNAASSQIKAEESDDLPTLFAKLKQHKDYPMLKSALKGSMGGLVLPTILPMIAKQSPILAKVIKANKQAFLKLINDDHDK